MTEQELKKGLDKLDKLKAKLEEMKAPIKKDMNLFSMVGLAKQEINHSYFLTSLLNGDNPFGNITIELLCEKIWEYKHQYNRVKQNEEILKKNNSNLDMNAFKKAFDMVEVKREVHFSFAGEERSLDILITSKSSNSIMVLENKTGSDTHDDQLCAYETYIDQNYADYDNKIFVFLSPNGEMPINKGGDNKYNDRWCIFDYTVNNGVLSIIETLLNKIKGKKIQTRNSLYLRKILGDYIEMVNLELLNNKDVLKKCRDIVKEYKEELDMIKEYLSVFEEIQNFLKNEHNNPHTNLCIDDICLGGKTYSQITFTTAFTRANFKGDVWYSIEYDTATDENIVGVGRKKDSIPKNSTYNQKILEAYEKTKETNAIVPQKIYFTYSEFFKAQDKSTFVADKLNQFLEKIDDIEKKAYTIMQSNP